jgi:hypothetical protein
MRLRIILTYCATARILLGYYDIKLYIFYNKGDIVRMLFNLSIFIGFLLMARYP